VKYGFETLFEFTAILGARYQATHIEREQGAVLHQLRHVTPDDSLRQINQIDPILRQRLIAVFWIGRGDTLMPSNLGHCGPKRVLRNTGRCKRLRNLAVRRLQHGRNHMLDRDELISHLISRCCGLGKEFSDFGIHRRRDPLSREGGPSVKPVLQFLLQYLTRHAEAGEDSRQHTLLLLEKSHQQMDRANLGMGTACSPSWVLCVSLFRFMIRRFW